MRLAAPLVATLALWLAACGGAVLPLPPEDQPDAASEAIAGPDAAAQLDAAAQTQPPARDASTDLPPQHDASTPLHPGVDASSTAPARDASQPSSFEIPSMGVEPAKIAPGDTVTVSVDVRSVGAATIADGVVAVVATAPDGRTFTQSSKSVAVAAGKTVKVDQQRGPYTVVGTWVFRASFTDAAGTVLAKGPAAGASMDVTAPTGPVKVLLYSGSDTATDDVAGTVDALSQASAGNWIPGTTFTVTKTTVVDASSLAGQDVVIVPGGDSGRAYLADSNLDGAALRAFVTGGKGYFGTCAGAYAATSHVHGTLDGTTYDYDGWGLAPHVTAQPVGYVGQLPVAISAAGEPILGVSGTITLMHYRGPAMAATGTAQILATFADGKTGFPGAGDIVTDSLGTGRTVLCASHPEVAPTHFELVAHMVAWAAHHL